MQGRPGPFWDGVEGRAPIPPAAATLGFLEASLSDADGAVVATATARVIPLSRAPAAA